jgi:small-conductance mechanosensitive channel
MLVFAVTLAATQGLRRWLDARFLPLTRLDLGLRNSISATLGYVGFIFAAALALSYVGLGFEKLAIVAGALSVGIGFGLQSIVNNFVSGLILLWERAIRVGDWVVVGDEQGYVKRINVRSTEIETFDRATMIVPNSNLVAGVVKNWLRGDRVGRIKVALAPHAGVDPEKMRDVMLAAARAQEGVLRIPAPQVMFLGMEASSFKFELWCYVEDVEKSSRVRSDLHFDLHRRLREAGIRMTATAEAAPTVVQIPDLDKLVAAAAAGALAMGAGVLELEADGKGEEEKPTDPVREAEEA